MAADVTATARELVHLDQVQMAVEPAAVIPVLHQQLVVTQHQQLEVQTLVVVVVVPALPTVEFTLTRQGLAEEADPESLSLNT